ncbi:MAG TPA: LysR substrate-binding domain-containing protein [Casimicrobiaceae bacterium]|nr:LysR substrate-binding domain-containing protein [Casimicrobiaceae bacterium]
MLNLRSVDLNLLPVFEAAYEERSLSRAAKRLAMTQSAVSHALTRLRAVFRDELFVREARGVQPTPVADLIYAKVRDALGSVRQSVAESREFNPRTSERRFFVGISHPLGPMIAVRVLERLARAAPHVEVAFSTRSRPIELERGIREGRFDAVIDWLTPARGPFRELTLFNDAVVAVARSGNPALRRTRSIRDLRKGAFVSLRPRVDGEHPVPGLREWQRLELNYVLEVSEILEIFMVASRSDLFGLIPRSMLKFARDVFGLRQLRAGPKRISVPIKLAWHESRDTDPAHAFLRTQLQLASRFVVTPSAR